MKKMLAILLTMVLVGSALTGCGSDNKQTTGSKEQTSTGGASSEAGKENTSSGGAVSLNVTTTFAGEDGNAKNFQSAVKDWETSTGNKVNDGSATSDESFKARIATDFQTGSEADVLFYFTGADASSFIDGGKVVSIEEIREVYPDYAANMKDEMMAVAEDGKAYSIPVNGYWEAMFVNTTVLEAAGVEVPGTSYTWDQFLADCEKIKEAGYTPIAAALGNVPHYWFEFTIFNHLGSADHTTIPATAEESNALGWIAGIEDIKELYELNYFPANTLSAKDDETVQMFLDDKAAFLIDGSWKVGGIASACQSDPEDPATLDQEKLSNFTVTYVPSKDGREATDLIGGFSMGYYITRKAWEDADKREAAVSFVSHMTTNEMVSLFATHTATALKEAPEVDTESFTSLQIKAIEMMEGVTSFTPALQDGIPTECRTPVFDGMPSLVTGDEDITEAVQKCLDLIKERAE
ncbi:ABC transporter substrate-binding protein [Lachnospiraceae bacterium OttesenSCG-928-D06]|nr:ABC transporter substrate-binding protein [Lachnospiraceae bacterium OttesenSCG-928-D06]